MSFGHILYKNHGPEWITNPIIASDGSACPVQDMYSEDRRVWNRIFQMLAEDLAICEDGINVGGDMIYPIILGNKGDWSYLVSRLWCAIDEFIQVKLFCFMGLCIMQFISRFKGIITFDLNQMNHVSNFRTCKGVHVECIQG